MDLERLAAGLRRWQRHLHVHPATSAAAPQPPSSPVPLSRRVITLVEPVPGYPSFSLPADGPDRPRQWDDVVSETVPQNSVELWEIVNTTGDTHPIHLHLVQFRIVARYPYDDVWLTSPAP